MLEPHRIALMCLLLLGATSTRPNLTTRATVEVINCYEDLREHAMVSVSTFGNSNKPTPVEVLKQAAVTEISEGIYKADFDLEPANYTFMVHSTHCKTPGPINLTLFSGHERQFIVALTKGYSFLLSLTDRAIGVEVPKGAVARLVQGSDKAFSRDGVRDDNITYFENLPPGEYDLEVRVRSVIACAKVAISQEPVRRLYRLDLAQLAEAIRGVSVFASRNGCGGEKPDFILIPESTSS